MKLPAQPNQSLIDGLAVLQAITVAGEPIGGRALARELQLEPTRVHRLLKTLAALGLTHQTPSRKYAVGAGVHVLAAQALYGSGLLRRALPILRDLHRLGCTVALGVLWRREVCYLYHGQGSMPAEACIGTTGLFPAERSGIGHALLAQLPAEALSEHFPDGLPDSLRALATVRRQGWAWVERGGDPPSATLAVPVGEPAYAAIALAGKPADLHRDSLLPPLRSAAQSIDLS